jgi:hypothetical protein
MEFPPAWNEKAASMAKVAQQHSRPPAQLLLIICPAPPFLRFHSFPINALTYKVAIPSSLSFRAVKEPLGPLCELELGIFNPKLTILLCIVLTWLS